MKSPLNIIDEELEISGGDYIHIWSEEGNCIIKVEVHSKNKSTGKFNGTIIESPCKIKGACVNENILFEAKDIQ